MLLPGTIIGTQIVKTKTMQVFDSGLNSFSRTGHTYYTETDPMRGPVPGRLGK
jgi:hypothetical protein